LYQQNFIKHSTDLPAFQPVCSQKTDPTHVVDPEALPVLAASPGQKLLQRDQAMSVLRHIKDVPIPQGVGGVVPGLGLIRVCVCVCRVPLCAWSLRVRVFIYIYVCVCIYI
jgi:hypothetical protein